MAGNRYEYNPHPHIAAREASGPPVSTTKHHPHRDHALRRFNERIGLAITRRVGTMWAAYAFFALSLVSLPAALSTGDTIVIVAWLAQTFLQLVLLPIIIVGQNLQARAADERAIATYKDAGAILAETKEIQEHLSSQDKSLAAIAKRLEKLENHER